MNNVVPALQDQVAAALAEDVGDGDVTGELVDAAARAEATIITREPAVLCGRPWAEEVFRQLGDVQMDWHGVDGDRFGAGQPLCMLRGSARTILSGERTALNFLQTLSATATLASRYADAVVGTRARILDTRKTVPGLRAAQKYAVRCGGCHNHRIGLYDAYLVKDNHIAACGGIAAAVRQARERHPGLLLEVEVESLAQLEQAIECDVDRVLLDNFDQHALSRAVALSDGRVELEASGNVSLETIAAIAATGVDFISVGALTKNVCAVDLSLRLTLAS